MANLFIWGLHVAIWQDQAAHVCCLAIAARVTEHLAAKGVWN